MDIREQENKRSEKMEEEISKYKVSNDTAGFLDIVIKLNGVYSEIDEALKKLYGDDVGIEIFSRDFESHLKELDENINKCIIDSIRGRLYQIGNKTV